MLWIYLVKLYMNVSNVRLAFTVNSEKYKYLCCNFSERLRLLQIKIFQLINNSPQQIPWGGLNMNDSIGTFI